MQLWDILNKDFKDLGIIEKLSFCKSPTFFYLQGFHFFISPSNLLEVLNQFVFVWFNHSTKN